MIRNVIVALAVLGGCSIGFVVTAADSAKNSANVETITFKAVKTKDGAAIEVTSGDIVFLARSITMPAYGKVSEQEVTVKDGMLTMRIEEDVAQFEAMTMSLQRR